MNDQWNGVVSIKPISKITYLKSMSQIRKLVVLVFEKINVNIPNFTH